MDPPKHIAILVPNDNLCAHFQKPSTVVQQTCSAATPGIAPIAHSNAPAPPIDRKLLEFRFAIVLSLYFNSKSEKINF